jgi:hypothetical protein
MGCVARPENSAAYLTNLTPNDWPRRQTTSHCRPVLASRENASRTRPDSTLESATVIFAPVDDMSCTKHWRAAKPPSRVTHPVCCTDLRTSRFLAAATFSFPAGNEYPCLLADGTLKTVAISEGFPPHRLKQNARKTPLKAFRGKRSLRGLPGRANAIIRSPASLGCTHGQTRHGCAVPS